PRNGCFPWTLRALTIAMMRLSPGSMRHFARGPVPVGVPLLALLFLVLALLTSVAVGGSGSATGSANVRLVRLLSEVPEDFKAARTEHLHDLRVHLVHGNVLLFRKGREFAALLPIETFEGHPDSLSYFFYVERAPQLWLFSGARLKGIRAVADGGSLQFDSFKLLWGKGGEGLGWIYFPDIPADEHLRFSVVSGQFVDQADPKETRYWVELGSETKPGF